MNRKIIQSAENAFFCHAQNACQETERKIGIILEGPGEQVAHEANYLFIEPGCVALLDGRVVLIDDNNGWFPVMDVKHIGKVLQSSGQPHLGDRAIQDAAEVAFVIFRAPVTVEQRDVSAVFSGDHIPHGLVSLFPGWEFHILECDKDNRVLPLFFAVFCPAIPDLHTFKIFCCVFLRELKKGLKHAHCERFSKSPWTGKQGHLGTGIQKIFNQHGLVDIVISVNQLFEIRDSDREREPFRRL